MNDAPHSLRNELMAALVNNHLGAPCYAQVDAAIDAARQFAARGSVEAREVATLIGLSCDGTCCGGT